MSIHVYMCLDVVLKADIDFNQTISTFLPPLLRCTWFIRYVTDYMMM